MKGKVALIAFVAAQAGASALWMVSLGPLTQPGAPPFISETAQIWSGGAEAQMSENFRRGETTELAAPFQPYAELLWATLLIVASLVPVWLGRHFFLQGKGMLAAASLFVALAIAAGGAFMIVQHWGGSTLYPPGFANTGWLYMSARTFLLQMAIGYVALVATMGLASAGLSSPEKPLGFHLAALNWAIVVGVWAVIYVGFYLAPTLMRSSGQG